MEILNWQLLNLEKHTKILVERDHSEILFQKQGKAVVYSLFLAEIGIYHRLL